MSDLLGGWLKIKLSDIAELIMGQSPPSSTYNTRGQGLPFFQGKAEFGDFYPIAIKYCSSPIKIAEVGDVLISVRAPVGPTNLCKEKSCIGRGLAALRPSSGITTKYLFYYLRNIEDWLSTQGTGSTFTAITKEDLENIEVILPPLNEQRRIVAKLEKLLGKVDACKERLEKIPIILKRFRQSVLSAACSGRLTSDWREENPDVEPAEELLKRIQGDSIGTKTSERKKNQKDKFLDVNSAKLDSSELPDTWIFCKLSLLAELITKGASPNWQGINYTDQGILFITSENVGLGHLVLKNKKYVEERFNVLQKRSILMKGDLLTNIVGASIGRSAIFELDEKANINQAVALIRLDDEVNRHYILNVLNSPDLIGFMYQEKVDVARANLNLEDISNFPIPLPPLPEQQEIVRRVEALFKIADQIEERYKKARGYVDKLTQSILAKAFRGELVPQDPNDESASVLLERIREERNRRRDKSQTGKTKNHRRQRRQNQLRMDI